jgi:hypothetical protein
MFPWSTSCPWARASLLSISRPRNRPRWMSYRRRTRRDDRRNSGVDPLPLPLPLRRRLGSSSNDLANELSNPRVTGKEAVTANGPPRAWWPSQIAPGSVYSGALKPEPSTSYRSPILILRRKKECGPRAISKLLSADRGKLSAPASPLPDERIAGSPSRMATFRARQKRRYRSYHQQYRRAGERLSPCSRRRWQWWPSPNAFVGDTSIRSAGWTMVR